jgi:hypothetical protein
MGNRRNPLMANSHMAPLHNSSMEERRLEEHHLEDELHRVQRQMRIYCSVY